MSDFYDYGAEFVIGGNALGDSSAKNDTDGDKKKEESFHDKYRRELKKDFDDLIADDEEEDEDLNAASTNGTESVSGESENEDETPTINLDDLMNDEEEPEEEAAQA